MAWTSPPQPSIHACVEIPKFGARDPGQAGPSRAVIAGISHLFSLWCPNPVRHLAIHAFRRFHALGCSRTCTRRLRGVLTGKGSHHRNRHRRLGQWRDHRQGRHHRQGWHHRRGRHHRERWHHGRGRRLHRRNHEHWRHLFPARDRGLPGHFDCDEPGREPVRRLLHLRR